VEVASVNRLILDVRQAGRTLVKSPGFSAVVIATLALGIGFNSAMFTLVDAVLLRTLPLPRPQELFFIEKVGPDEPRSDIPIRMRLSYPVFERLRAAAPAARIAAFSSIARFNMAGLSDPMRGQLVSGGLFGTLGVGAAIGRTLTPDDDRSTAPVAVLSHGCWKRRFAQDPSVLGRVLSWNGTAATVVGVAAPEFFGIQPGVAPDVWLPLRMQPQARYNLSSSSQDAQLEEPWLPQAGIEWLSLVARMPGGSPAETLARVNTVFAQEPHEPGDSTRLVARPAGQGLASLRGRFSEPLRILSAMVGLILLVACANVANLMLARAAGRRKELAVRLAIGATRARVVRGLITESALLAGAGGVLGWLGATWGTAGLLRLLAGGSSPIPVGIRPDARVLLFTGALAVATTLLFGLAPALRSTRIDLVSSLKADARGARSGERRDPGAVLVVAQVALSLVLLLGAGLFVRSFGNLMQAPVGFDRDRVVTVRLDVRAAGYRPTDLPGLYQRLVDAARAVPGVRLATVALSGIASGSARTSGIVADGRRPGPGEHDSAQENFVGVDYFATVGMPLLHGRAIDTRDTATSPRVAVVNEAMARHFFGAQDPIGKRIGYDAEHVDVEIVGVVRDARVRSLREEPSPLIYRPIVQAAEYAETLDVRTDRDALAVGAEVRKAVAAVDPTLPVVGVNTLAQQLEGTLGTERLIARLSGLFAVLALALAGLGLYGVSSYGVSRRTREIGVRMAVGASAGAVKELILGRTLRLTMLGILLGLPLGLLGAHAVAAQLYGLSAADPATLGLAIVVVLAIAAVAGYAPARRAARLEPTAALRMD
jgi:predicted permease